MSRTFVVGQPPAELAGYQRIVRAALDAAAAEVAPGVSSQAVYNAAADVIEAAGYPTPLPTSPASRWKTASTTRSATGWA